MTLKYGVMHWISSDAGLVFAASACRLEYHEQRYVTGVSTRKEAFTSVSPVPGAWPTQRSLNRKSTTRTCSGSTSEPGASAEPAPKTKTYGNGVSCARPHGPGLSGRASEP